MPRRWEIALGVAMLALTAGLMALSLYALEMQ